MRWFDASAKTWTYMNNLFCMSYWHQSSCLFAACDMNHTNDVLCHLRMCRLEALLVHWVVESYAIKSFMDDQMFYSLLFIPAISLLPGDPFVTMPRVALLSPHARALVSSALIGISINGPKTLSGMALRSMLPPHHFGIGGGLLGVFAQCGVFFSGTGVGWLLQNYQWTHFITVLQSTSFCSILLLLTMVIMVKREDPAVSKKRKIK